MLFAFKYIESESLPKYVPASSGAGSAIYLEIDKVDTIEGIPISYSLKNDRIYFVLDDSSCEIEDVHISLGKIQASAQKELIEDPSALIGCKVVIRGKLTRPESADNPRCFDHRLYLKSKSLYYLFRGYEIDECSDYLHGFHIRHIRHMIKLRDGFLSIFQDDETRGFVKGIIFGDKSEIDEEFRELFNTNATGHILAVSGLHVGFLYSLIRFISGRKKDKLTVAVTIAVLLLYGEMTMWSASTIRAVLVLSMCLMARHVRRPFDLLTSVSAAALVILVNNPYQLLNTGFQLSFTALTSIAFLCKPLAAIFGESLAMMISVQIGIVPLSAFLFNRINMMSIFINIPVISLAGIIVPFYLIMLLIYLFLGTAPETVTTIAEGLERMMIKLNQLLASDGGFSSKIVSIEPAIIIAFYMMVLFIFSDWFRVKYFRSEWREVLKCAACIMLVAIIIFSASYKKFMNDEVVFASVGQGSCIHMRTPSGKNILIDGGGREDYNIGKKVLEPYLLKNGVRRIDLALATHLDVDHYKGLEELSELGMIDKLITNRDGYAAGDIVYEENGFRIVVLAPLRRYANSSTNAYNSSHMRKAYSDERSNTEENENSLVFRIDYDDYSIIATGDIGKSTEQEIIDFWARRSHGIDLPSQAKSALDADIVAVPHHGSKNSSSEEFIEAVSPMIAVIQVGKNNMYGHPAQETLEKYESHEIMIYRNDIQGAIGVDRDLKIDTVK